MIIPCCEINTRCATIGWLLDELPEAFAEGGYTQPLYVTGVTFPATFTLLSGSLPEGLSLSSAGVLSGVLAPGTEGVYEFTVQVYDKNGCSSTKAYSLTVGTPEGYYTWGTAPMLFGTSNLIFGQPWPIS